LIAASEPINQQDNEKLTALAYALRNQDLAAARQLLVLDAHPDTQVRGDRISGGPLPALSDDAEAVRMLRQSRVNYSKITFRGATALEIAKGLGDPGLIDALGGKQTNL
jgi:ankyrin repeat protein